MESSLKNYRYVKKNRTKDKKIKANREKISQMLPDQMKKLTWEKHGHQVKSLYD